jgi:hypothetical protein
LSKVDEAILQAHRDMGDIFRVNTADASHAAQEARDRLGALPPLDPETPDSWEACEIITGDLRVLLGFLGEAAVVSSRPAGFRTLVLTILRYLDESDQTVLGLLLAGEINVRWTAELGREHLDRIAAVDQLAVYMRARGQSKVALPLVEEALGLYSRIHGQNHPATLNAVVNLCACLVGRGDALVASRLSRKILPTCVAVLGRDSDITLRANSVFAESMFELGETRTALDVYRDVHARCRKTKGRDHLATLNAAGKVAIVLHGLGDHEKARAMNEDSLHRYERLLGTNKNKKGYNREDRRIKESRKRLVANLESLGRHEEAREVGGLPDF